MQTTRRQLLQLAGTSGLAWLTPLAETLAWQHETNRRRQQAKSVILLWLKGGPSQLETFDPHAGHEIAGGTSAIKTSVPGIELAAGLERTAEVMDEIMLIRNAVSKEGDHERAFYNVQTGYRPDPSLVHPSLGAVLCHQLPDSRLEIPQHVSILPHNVAARGGYLGNEYDAFQMGDPQGPLRDMKPGVSQNRFQRRLNDLEFINRRYAARIGRTNSESLPSEDSNLSQATRMMSSEQLSAFSLEDVPEGVLHEFGDSAFGRGCLVAARLTELGVRCVEVTSGGWDTHVANHELHDERKRELDPALAGLICYLRERNRLDNTLVICAGEFGRTPTINPAGGRDHWPHGFSIALAGGGLPRGTVIGETDPDGSMIRFADGIRVSDIHASIMHRLGVDPTHEIETPIGRPIKLSEGEIVF